MYVCRCSYGAGEDANLSANVTVSLGSVYANIKLSACTETTLTANQPLAEVPKTTYRSLEKGADGSDVIVETVLPVVPQPPAGDAMDVTVGPMQIRTFMCTTA